MLSEKRRKYLIAIKKEKEQYASIHNQVRDNPKEYKLYQKLKYLNTYHKRSGVDAILQKRVNLLRAKVNMLLNLNSCKLKLNFGFRLLMMEVIEHQFLLNVYLLKGVSSVVQGLYHMQNIV